MSEKRLVIPVLIGSSETITDEKGAIIDQAFTSLNSYFLNGNEVPAIVVTDSPIVKKLVDKVAAKTKFDITADFHDTRDIVATSIRWPIPEWAKGNNYTRPFVTYSKLFTLLSTGSGYDRLVCDADTLFFDIVPWDKFDQTGFAAFQPKQWEHPHSITVKEMLFWRYRWLDKCPGVPKRSFKEYMEALVAAHPGWQGKVMYDQPWINSGMYYITEDYRNKELVDAMTSVNYDLLYVEDETPLFSALNEKTADFGKKAKLFTDIGMNVPVGYTDITDDANVLAPQGVIAAHYHKSPKPHTFAVNYKGQVIYNQPKDPWVIDYNTEHSATDQYWSLNGKLWTFLWLYYYSMVAQHYKKPSDWYWHPPMKYKESLENYMITRDSSLIWKDAVETFKP